jgi:hypothetical protein
MVPLEPGEASAIGADTRGGAEVAALHEDSVASGVVVGIEGDNGVDGFLRLVGVVFADTDEAAARGVDYDVCIAQIGFGGDGAGIRAGWVEAVEAIIGEVGEEEGAA